MNEALKGSTYYLDNLKSGGTTHLQFYVDPEIHGFEIVGTSCQEVIRALISRVKFLDEEKTWAGNKEIIQKLRECIALFEGRALLVKAEKGVPIEQLPTGADGHIV